MSCCHPFCVEWRQRQRANFICDLAVATVRQCILTQRNLAAKQHRSHPADLVHAWPAQRVSTQRHLQLRHMKLKELQSLMQVGVGTRHVLLACQACLLLLA